jgi:hypothetical protein
MPIHDWTRVDAGLFHDFHQRWAVGLSNGLNAGVLPRDYFALVDQNVRAPISDVLILRLNTAKEEPARVSQSMEILQLPIMALQERINQELLENATWEQTELNGDETPVTPEGEAEDESRTIEEKHAPRTRLTQRAEAYSYVRKASRITVRHRHGKVVAVVEIVSPGNKASQAEFRALVEKSADLIRQGVHLLVIDLFPPGKRDPQGIHKAIWDEFEDKEIELPADKPLTIASYDAGPDYVAYVEFVGVGDPLPEMPLFLKPDIYVPAPLETSYQNAWRYFPAPLKGLLDPSATA